MGLVVIIVRFDIILNSRMRHGLFSSLWSGFVFNIRQIEDMQVNTSIKRSNISVNSHNLMVTKYVNLLAIVGNCT